MRWPFSGENEIVVPTVNLRTVNMARMYECYLNIKPCFILTMILITSDQRLNYYLESTVHCINYSLLCVVRTAIFTIFGNVFYSTEIINNESGGLINATVHVGNVSAIYIRLSQIMSRVEDITVIQRDNHRNAATPVISCSCLYSFNLIVQLLL